MTTGEIILELTYGCIKPKTLVRSEISLNTKLFKELKDYSSARLAVEYFGLDIEEINIFSFNFKYEVDGRYIVMPVDY